MNKSENYSLNEDYGILPNFINQLEQRISDLEKQVKELQEQNMKIVSGENWNDIANYVISQLNKTFIKNNK